MRLCVAFILMFMMSLLVGCSKEEVSRERICWFYVIPNCNQKACANWMNKAIGSANPKSDEEPEDWLPQIQDQANKLYGVLVIGHRRFDNERTIYVPYFLLPESDQIVIREYLGRTPTPEEQGIF